MKNYTEKINSLLCEMTLREKIAQVAQTVAGYRCFYRCGENFEFNDEFKNFVSDWGAMGAISNVLRADTFTNHDWGSGIEPSHRVRFANMMQKYIMDNARLPIPVLIEVESNHGVHALGSTVFPTSLGIGCSFNPEIYSEIMRSVGKEIKLSGNHMGFVTMLDIARDPRWGRCEELFSEDPYLAGKMTKSGVEGFKKDGPLICCKHFCGAGDGFGGINTAEVNIGIRELHDIHIPPTEKAIQSGADVIMAAYNTIDGIPCHVNPYLLKNVLRDELGFNGIILSDGFAVTRAISQMGLDPATGAATVLKSGIDISLADMGAYLHLEEAINDGIIEESVLDESVVRILEKKFELGLFDDPYIEEDNKLEVYLSSGEQKKIAYNSAAESFVLLKNNGALPFSSDKKIALIGAHAENIYHMLGTYTPFVKPNTKSLKDVFEESFANIEYTRGWDFFGKDESNFEHAFEIASRSDIIIVTIGGTSAGAMGGDVVIDQMTGAVISSKVYMDCGEGIDRSELCLPGNQLKLIEKLKETGKPIVALLVAGRPYELTRIDEICDAVLAVWYPGEEGPRAIVDTLTGKINPSGKLSMSFPYHSSCLPCYYNRYTDNNVVIKDTWFVNAYCDHNKRILYPFGYGLSYSRFEYSDIEVTKVGDIEYEVGINVENLTDIPGKEVVELYIHASACSVRRRLRELKGFRKIFLAAHEKKKVTFTLGYNELKVFSQNNRYDLESCKVDIFVGGGCDVNSPDKATVLSTSISL